MLNINLQLAASQMETKTGSVWSNKMSNSTGKANALAVHYVQFRSTGIGRFFDSVTLAVAPVLALFVPKYADLLLEVDHS